MNLPFLQAAEENRQVILEAVRPYLRGSVLEIGSGTGQHAVYFADQLPALNWQTSDLEENLAGIAARIEQCGPGNLPPPLQLDVLGEWPDARYDTIYSANSLHIIGEVAVARFIDECGRHLHPDGNLVVYGPFNYHGEFTSASNARFDEMLKAKHPDSGIKDFEWLDTLARTAGMALEADIEMPANNRSLIWKKRTL